MLTALLALSSPATPSSHALQGQLLGAGSFGAVFHATLHDGLVGALKITQIPTSPGQPNRVNIADLLADAFLGNICSHYMPAYAPRHIGTAVTDDGPLPLMYQFISKYNTPMEVVVAELRAAVTDDKVGFCVCCVCEGGCRCGRCTHSLPVQPRAEEEQQGAAVRSQVCVCVVCMCVGGGGTVEVCVHCVLFVCVEGCSGGAAPRLGSLGQETAARRRLHAAERMDPC